MDQHVASKRRTLVNAQVKATAAAEAFPTFPTGPTNERVVFAGDFLGARIVAFEWSGTFSGFTAADLTLQHSHDGETWHTLKAATQDTSSPVGPQMVYLLDTDPHPLRFVRALITMTGTPGTSTHTVYVHFDQIGPRGAYAPPGMIDRPN